MTSTSAFVVHRDSPYRTLKDLVEAAKRRPGTISVGSSGIGTDDHLGLTLFEVEPGDGGAAIAETGINR